MPEPTQSIDCVRSGALYPEKCGDERQHFDRAAWVLGALYPEKCGDEREDLRLLQVLVGALYPEKCGDERRTC